MHHSFPQFRQLWETLLPVKHCCFRGNPYCVFSDILFFINRPNDNLLMCQVKRWLTYRMCWSGCSTTSDVERRLLFNPPSFIEYQRCVAGLAQYLQRSLGSPGSDCLFCCLVQYDNWQVPYRCVKSLLSVVTAESCPITEWCEWQTEPNLLLL